MIETGFYDSLKINRVFELIGIQAKDVNLDKHIFETTIKDERIDTYSTKIPLKQ